MTEKETDLPSRILLNAAIGLLFGALTLYIAEHFGNFTYSYIPSQEKISEGVYRQYQTNKDIVQSITYTTPFQTGITENVSGMDVGDIIFSHSDFNSEYSAKAEYYFSGFLKDFWFLFLFAIPFFALSWFIGNRKIKIRTVEIERQEQTIEEEKRDFVPQRQKLENLKDKGLLSMEDYTQKIKELDRQSALQKINGSPEYKQLEELKEDGILTHEEFEEKVEILKKRVLEDYEN